MHHRRRGVPAQDTRKTVARQYHPLAGRTACDNEVHSSAYEKQAGQQNDFDITIILMIICLAYLFSLICLRLYTPVFKQASERVLFFTYYSALAKRTQLCYYARHRLRAVKTMEVYTNEQD